MTKKVEKLKDSLQIPKAILYTAKFLESISPNLATLFAAKLFTTPIKHKIPKREFHMNENSVQSKLWIPDLKKEIVIYKYGQAEKKILLVHGWSGRGTQLFKIADGLVENGYSTISFDAPAHGKSKGSDSIMTEFITAIHEIDKQFGPFEFAVGHSLGGMAVLNAINQNFNVKKVVVIGSGDIILDIIIDFVKKLKLNEKYALKLKKHFEKKFGEPMENYASSFVSQNILQPVLIIHDKDDDDVSVEVAYQIKKALKNSELLITEGLGHRRILGDKKVISKIVAFLQ